MGFIDPNLIQRRFWRFLVGGKELPDFLTEMIDEVSFTETQSGKSDGHITFIDTPNKISQNGKPVQTLNDLASEPADKSAYFFDFGREVIMQIGHSVKACEAFPLVMAAFRPTFPPNGDPTLEIYTRDRSYYMQKSRTLRNSKVINKLSELVEIIANSYGFGTAIIDDYEYENGYTITPGSDNDYTILSKECKAHGRWWKVIGNTLTIANNQKVLNDNADDPRYNLYYRMGDNSIKSFTPQEKTNSGGVAPNAPNLHAICRELNSGVLVVAGLDKEVYGQNSTDWTKELSYVTAQSVYDPQRKSSPFGSYDTTDPKYANPVREGLYFGENTPLNFGQETNYQKATPEQKFQFDRNLNSLYGFIADDQSGAGHWETVIEERKEPEDNNNQEPGEFKDKEAAIKKVSSTGLSENYDATLETFMFDPFLRIGTKINVFGVGHRHEGPYRIVGRSISMSRSTPPSLVIFLKRVARPAPATSPVKVSSPVRAQTRLEYANDAYSNLGCSTPENRCGESPQGEFEQINKFDAEGALWNRETIKKITEEATNDAKKAVKTGDQILTKVVGKSQIEANEIVDSLPVYGEYSTRVADQQIASELDEYEKFFGKIPNRGEKYE